MWWLRGLLSMKKGRISLRDAPFGSPCKLYALSANAGALVNLHLLRLRRRCYIMDGYSVIPVFAMIVALAALSLRSKSLNSAGLIFSGTLSVLRISSLISAWSSWV